MVKRRKKGITKKGTGKGFNEAPQEAGKIGASESTAIFSSRLREILTEGLGSFSFFASLVETCWRLIASLAINNMLWHVNITWVERFNRKLRFTFDYWLLAIGYRWPKALEPALLIEVLYR